MQDKDGNVNGYANSNNKYHALSNVNLNQKQNVLNNFSKPMTPSANVPMTPFVEQANYESNRYENTHRGKTAPSSVHNSKERAMNSDVSSGQTGLKEKLQNHNKCNSAQNMIPPAVVQNNNSQHPKMTKQTSGMINLANGLPKRSESQKTRAQEHPHFLKRKDCISSVESQKEDISQVLKSNKVQNDSQNNGNIKSRNASKENAKHNNSEKN